MAGSVIIRHGTDVDDEGYIQHNETPLGWSEADAKAGFRLDRRKLWAFMDDELCELIQWTDACSGCSCDCGCMGGHGAGGCSECGYQGKVRNGQWIPYSPPLPNSP